MHAVSLLSIRKAKRYDKWVVAALGVKTWLFHSRTSAKRICVDSAHNARNGNDAPPHRASAGVSLTSHDSRATLRLEAVLPKQRGEHRDLDIHSISDQYRRKQS